MNSPKDDEDFWNTKDISHFDFDHDESDKLFGVSIEHAEQVKAGIAELGAFKDFSSKSYEQDRFIKPLSTVLSDKIISKIIEVDKLQFSDSQEISSNEPNATIERILLGRPYTLEQFKSLSSKTLLLDSAIKSYNGNAILGVLLFIKKTLNPSLFYKIILERSDAFAIYIHYLSDLAMSNEICDLYTMQGKTLDAALRCLNIIILNHDDSESNAHQFHSKINKIYKVLFHDLIDYREGIFLQKYVDLIDWQKKSYDKFSEPMQYNISALKCLYFICKEFWGLTESNSLSPTAFVKSQDISLQQFLKYAMMGRASIQAWDDIDDILHKKGWFGGKKLYTTLPMTDIIKILLHHQAPSTVLEKFLNYVESTKRLQLAKSIGCNKAVINISMSQGDRLGLLEYKDKHLKPNSEDYFYADSILKNNRIRWKN